MEVLVVLGVIALLIWLMTRGKPSVAKSQRTSVGRARTRPTTAPNATGGAVVAQNSASAEDCWVPPSREVTVAGYRIPGGMLYVGQGLASIAGHYIEPALIDSSLRVDRSNPVRNGEGMTYWPSYSAIPPGCRAAYLEWLAGGRRDSSAYIGYVFLYFYGLERRVLAEAPRSERAKQDVPAITREVEELLEVYRCNNSFQRYATRLLDVLKLVAAPDGEVEPPMERTGYELPVSLRASVGRIIAAGKPLPADWALSWFLTHPETSLRMPARRCPEEFRELFRARYGREFGAGLVIKPNRSKLKMNITPASASFGGQVELCMDLPDISTLAAPLSKLNQIGDNCAVDLDAFSRWVGRNADAPKTIAAVALLPADLAATHGCSEARALWEWVGQVVGPHNRAVCHTDDLLRHCSSFGSGKLAKSEAVLLAQLLEKQGYGIEPDVRFGGGLLAPAETAVLFKLPLGAAPVATPQYAAATILLHFAVAVSASDGSISASEEQRLEEHMQRALGLSDAERVRLSAHLAWLLQSRPSLSGLKKRLEPLDLRQRSAIADFIIGVAGADGQISPDEIRTLSKIYPMLGLAADDVYGHVHAMAAGTVADVADSEPITIIPLQASTRYTIPPSPGGPAVLLNMTVVKAKLAESAQISAILEDIFTEEAPENVPSIPLPAKGKVPAAYGILLSRLAERPEWSRAEFEAIAGECKLMPDGAVDALNEAAFEHAGAPVLEGDDPIQVDPATAKELLA